MPRPPTAMPWTDAPTRPSRPLLYRPRPSESADLPVAATWLTPDERLRVDAAGQATFRADHFDSADALGSALLTRPYTAVLLSVAVLAQERRSAGSAGHLTAHQGAGTVDAALGRTLRAAAALPTAALVSAPPDLATVLTLGRAGIHTIIDVQQPAGWTALRTTLAATARPTVARLAAQTLAPLLTNTSADVQRFVGTLFAAPPRVMTVRDLARGFGVLPTTLMSRFFRAALPTPRRYLAYARLTRAAHLLGNGAWSVAAVADHLEYSSAQGFSRHLHQLLGVRPAEFRRRYDAGAMLTLFGSELLAPYQDVLRTFHPLRADNVGPYATTPRPSLPAGPAHP